jgi:hypothetical protein
VRGGGGEGEGSSDSAGGRASLPGIVTRAARRDTKEGGGETGRVTLPPSCSAPPPRLTCADIAPAPAASGSAFLSERGRRGVAARERIAGRTAAGELLPASGGAVLVLAAEKLCTKQPIWCIGRKSIFILSRAR